MNNYNYNILNRNIATAIADELIEYQGQLIFYRNGTQPLSIRLNSRDNDQITLNPKDYIVAPFDRFYFSGGAYGETVELFLSSNKDIKIVSNQFDVDIVSTLVELRQDKTKYFDSLNSENVFMRTVWQSAVSAKKAHCQLLNPTGSGKNVIIERLAARCVGATPTWLLMYPKHTALTTLDTIVTTNVNFGSTVSAVARAYYAEGVSADLTAAQAIVTRSGKPTENSWAEFISPTEASIILPPGKGVAFIAATDNISIYIECTWKEVDV